MTMSYRELREKINALPEDRLDDDVTLYDHRFDEYCSAEDLEITTGENEVLDEGHAFIILKQ